MTVNGPGVHSPIGASSIKRGLLCSASVGLSYGVHDEESDHASLGTAVHGLIERCFKSNTDGWQQMKTWLVEAAALGLDTDAARKMTNAAQVMLNAVRAKHTERNQGNFWVERRFHCPTIHPLFFGTSDVVALEITEQGEIILHVWDYKNGAGVVIEVEENEQGMYYACGALEDLRLWDQVERVVIHIVQPNAFHYDGPVREWETTTEHLVEWLEDTLVPGMNHIMSDAPKTTKSGEHCRFCPVRGRACPQILADMEELEQMIEAMNKPGAPELTNAQIGRLLILFETAKIATKAANTTAFNRMQAGQKVPGVKLVKAKTFRKWKDEAEVAAKAEFGAEAFTQPEFKGPAGIEDLPKGKAFTTRWAYSPEAGLTVALESDKRREVEIVDPQSLFKPVAKAVEAVVPQEGGSRRRPHLSIVTNA